MYRGRIISDWDKVNPNDPLSMRKMWGAFNNHMKAPARPTIKAAIHNFAITGDFPEKEREIFDKFLIVPDDYDFGYEQIFDIRDRTGTTEAGFKLREVTGGAVFRKTPEGSRAIIRKISGDYVDVQYDSYGGALGWSKTLLADKDYATMEDIAVDFRTGEYEAKAAAYYGLLEDTTNGVPTGQNLAWQAVTGSVATSDKDYQAIRDINTINKACLDILVDLKDKGFAVTPKSQFLVVGPEQLRGRIENALDLTTKPYAASNKNVSYNLTPISTLQFEATDVYYVCLPKRKAKGGNRMDLTLYPINDVLANLDGAAGWARYAGAIGEPKQFVRCAIA